MPSETMLLAEDLPNGLTLESTYGEEKLDGIVLRYLSPARSQNLNTRIIVMPTVHFIPQSPLGHDPLAATVVIPLSSLPNTKKIGDVGYKFRKQFGTMGYFTGTVVEIIPNAEMEYDRRCVYTEDGDVEDLRIEDLVELAKLDDNQSQKDCSMKGSQSPTTATNHNASSSSAKKRQSKIKSSK